MTYVQAHRLLEEDMVDRNSKADDGLTALKPNFDAMVSAGVMSSATQPGGVAFNDEFATFLVRFENYLKQKYAWTGGGLSEDEVKAIINTSRIVAGQ
jgi:NADH:ubiquinone oxidoreductase subunit 4 (subunit M)